MLAIVYPGSFKARGWELLSALVVTLVRKFSRAFDASPDAVRPWRGNTYFALYLLVFAGGRQTVYTAGLNWYVNRNVRFMFDYLHGDVARQISAINAGDTGSKFDAFAMRTQVAL